MTLIPRCIAFAGYVRYEGVGIVRRDGDGIHALRDQRIQDLDLPLAVGEVGPVKMTSVLPSSAAASSPPLRMA